MRYAQEQISTALVLLKATGSPDRVVLVAEEIGYTPSLIYKWIREYREKGCFQPMKKTTANINVNPNDITSAEDICTLEPWSITMFIVTDYTRIVNSDFGSRRRYV